MKSKRIKSKPLASAEEFHAILDAVVQLEATKRKYEAARDLAVQRICDRFDAKLDPVLADLKGKLALAEAYADAHRNELLTTKAKSVARGLIRFGWREGNRKVEQRKGVTVEHVVNALKALGLGAYVATKEEIAKAKILADCKDNETLTVTVGGDKVAGFVTRTVPLANAGLRITQDESFYIEPASDAAETLKPEAVAA